MAAHSSILAVRIPWTEEPGRLPSLGLEELNTTTTKLPNSPVVRKKQIINTVRYNPTRLKI